MLFGRFRITVITNMGLKMHHMYYLHLFENLNIYEEKTRTLLIAW
ncbi:hypothetical protein MASR2M64_08620 [Candidatus Cloacimonadota bacterium]